MLQALCTLLVTLLLTLSSAPLLLAQTEEDNGAYLSAAIAAADIDDWEGAFALADRISDPIGVEVIEWMRLRDGNGTWDEYQRFLDRHADWPGLKKIRLRTEGVIPDRMKPKNVIAYFKDRQPQTGIGVLRLTAALTATGQKDKAAKEAIRAWRDFSMTKEERVALHKHFENTLKNHHVARLDMLLWRGLNKHAEGLYTLIPDGYMKLAKARIGLQKLQGGVDGLINAVPDELQSDPGLVYDRFRWRTRKNRYDGAVELMLAQSKSAKHLGRPEKWAERRRAYARQEMRDGNNKRAYQLASHHFLTSGSNYADLEWLSGYIALRKLDDPGLALEHLVRFRAAIATPISYGRAGYWQGRAHEALGNSAAAKEAYRFAANYQTSFYGQLAAEKIDAPTDSYLTGREKFPDWRTARFMKSSVLHAATLMHYADRPRLAERFIRHLGESLGRTELQQLANLTMEIGRPNIAVRLSKQAARQGHVLPRTYFPVTALAKKKLPVDADLAMSIARRESELDQFIVSPAGAMGLMQIMPKTARKVARDIGIPYSRTKLTSDWQYNARLGSTYLAEQLEDFNGSFILAFAAYNAGPHRARTWIERYGDPRKSQIDQIDWIEHIPFRETRNYVMRVMESLHVYRVRISGKVLPIRISQDLRKG